MRQVEIGMGAITAVCLIWAQAYHRVTDRRNRSARTGVTDRP